MAVGWLRYVGTLVSVIGIVQIGEQALADRFTYIPMIRLAIMAAWGIPELLKKWHYRKEAVFVMWALILPCLFVVTSTQAGYWQNSIALRDHALNVTNDNAIIHNVRGNAYSKLGNWNHVISDYDKAI
jgi:hypothetical protein